MRWCHDGRAWAVCGGRPSERRGAGPRRGPLPASAARPAARRRRLWITVDEPEDAAWAGHMSLRHCAGSARSLVLEADATLRHLFDTAATITPGADSFVLPNRDVRSALRPRPLPSTCALSMTLDHPAFSRPAAAPLTSAIVLRSEVLQGGRTTRAPMAKIGSSVRVW
jgi:hypothetical protein